MTNEKEWSDIDVYAYFNGISCICLCPHFLSFQIMPEPLAHRKIIKKRTARFTRFQVDRFKCMTDAWRHPRGIDSAMRR